MYLVMKSCNLIVPDFLTFLIGGSDCIKPECTILCIWADSSCKKRTGGRLPVSTEVEVPNIVLRFPKD